MNEIQDIILESEYNVLLALSEYYDKQLILESYYMEATGGISPAAAPDIIQRFINWCLKMISNIQNKTRQVPPRTPLPPAITRQAETVVQAANEYSDAANNGSSPEQVSQQMNDINNRVNASGNNQQNTNNNNNQSTMTVENLNEATKKVQQTIDQINNNIQQMEDVAGQAQDAANQNKLKAEKEKLKTGGGILKRLNELITSLTTPINSIEGEPISDLKGYSNNIIDTIKNATTEQAAQQTYDKAIETYKKLTKFYKDKLINGPVTSKEVDYCKSQVQKIQQWENGVKQVYEECIAKLKNGGGGQSQPTPQNNPQPQPTNDNNTQTNPQPQQNNPPQNNPSDQSSEPNIDPTEFKNVMAARYAKVNNKSEADEVYNSLKSELINAYNWYLKKRYDPAVSPPMKNRYGTQIKTIESLQKQNKIVYKDCINNLQPTDNQTQPTSQPQQNNPSQNNQPLTEEQKATIEQLKAYSWKPPTPPSGGDLWSYIDSLSFDTAANYVKPMLADIDKKLDYLNNYKTDDPQIESVVNNKKSWLRKMGDQLVFSVNDLHKDTDKSPLLNNPYNSKSQPINS